MMLMIATGRLMDVMMRMFLLVDGIGGTSVHVQRVGAGPTVAVVLMMPLRRVVFLVADRSDAGFANGGVTITSARGSHWNAIVDVWSVSLKVDEVMGIRIRPVAMNFVCKCRGFVITQ